MGNPGKGQVRVDGYPTYVQSGQITSAASGTVYTLPDVPCTSIFVSAHPSNAGNAWVGNSTGTMNGNVGYPVTTSHPVMVFSGVPNLNYLRVSFDKAGDKLCWLVETLE